MTDWHRTGRTSPVDSRTFPGGNAMVVRRPGGKWEGTITLTVDAGDDEKARAKVDALIRFLSPPGFTRITVPDEVSIASQWIDPVPPQPPTVLTTTADEFTRPIAGPLDAETECAG